MITKSITELADSFSEIKSGPIRVQQGKVISIENISGSKTLTVTIGGSEVQIPDVALLDSVYPIANAAIWVMSDGKDCFAFGSMNHTQTWIAPTLLNSWVNFAAGFTLSGYTKLITDEVVMQGLVKLGTATSVICNLPVGYRPPLTKVFTCSASGGSQGVRIDVLNNGNVMQMSFSTGSTNAYVSLEGIRFFTY